METFLTYATLVILIYMALGIVVGLTWLALTWLRYRRTQRRNTTHQGGDAERS